MNNRKSTLHVECECLREATGLDSISISHPGQMESREEQGQLKGQTQEDNDKNRC